VKNYLQKHPEVFLYFLPPYSPEYNPVEKLWWWIKPLVYGFSAMKEGLSELHRRIRKLIWHYNEGRIEGRLEFNMEAYSNIIKILAF
jgi:transposase